MVSVMVDPQGETRHLDNIRRYIGWPDVQEDVRMYLEACRTCKRGKTSSQKPGGLLQPLPVPAAPWAGITMDFIT